MSEDRFGEQMQSALAAVKQWKEPISPREVSEVCGMFVETARKYLSRLCEHGLIRRIAAGRYDAVPVSEVSRNRDADDEHDGQEAAA